MHGQISLAFPLSEYIQLIYGIYMYILNASGFLVVVDTWPVADWPWEISHRLLLPSRGLWALRIHVLGHALLRWSSAEG